MVESGESSSEEDVDFNPFRKETLSVEASSSLSSETEGIDSGVVESVQNPNLYNESNNVEHNREIDEIVTVNSEKEKELNTNDNVVLEVVSNPNTNLNSSNAIEVVNDNNNVHGELNNVTRIWNNLVDWVVDDDDAICRRTRARYSLASFTLDELETFLQETDDEDDFQNADDEEEYRKFLAAVLLDPDGEGKDAEGEGNCDDDDDDNDADFEMEIEEALESDPEDNIRIESQEERRPETRQNRREKALDSGGKKKVLGHVDRPLRPLVPIVPNFPAGPLTCPGGVIPHFQVSPPQDGFIHGFSQHQKAKLRGLIHEHVQLLIQVFTLSVVDSSKRYIANQVRELICEMLCQRDRPGPSPSIWDVASLHLVQGYMDDVSAAMQELYRRQVGSACGFQIDRQPLFPLPRVPSCSGADEVVFPETAAWSYPIPKSPQSQQLPKKSLAAAIVESAKKQPVAPVPKEIAKLAERFLSLFNPALYPHKHPPMPVANRVLFTDSEDELLALGMMEFNTDWKLIQQRFLPCKSKHQIFVRQKNRCSSKAPENPIKAVRRMKTSPLTAEEKARILEGLKVYKLDWMSIWKHVVPHRDPSLLPRQWRIALGTQKSYKSDGSRKEKRRLYELHRRKRKAVAMSSHHNLSEKEDCLTENARAENNSGDDHIDNEDAAYVHEAFLADWRPETSIPHDSASQQETNAKDQNTFRYTKSQPKGCMPDSLAASKHTQTLDSLSYSTHVGRCSLYPQMSIHHQPCRDQRTNSSQYVKLAPDLPPVNLPPSVRVISQSAFKSYPCEPGVSVSGGRTANVIPRLSNVVEPGNSHCTNAGQMPSGEHRDKCGGEERALESESHMHPLLFRAPEGGRFPYFSLNSGTNTSTFSFFPGNKTQVNLNLSPNSQQTRSSTDCFHNKLKSQELSSTSCGIEFHPLLQRTDDLNENSGIASSRSTQASAGLESFGGKTQANNPFGAVPDDPGTDSVPPVGFKPASPYERANELDLVIQLSSMSRKEKAVESRNVTKDNTTSKIELQPGNFSVTLHRNRLSSDSSGDSAETLVPKGICSNIVTGADELAVPGGGISRINIDNVGDQSLPGIVMEQEELSDSDEEPGEQVEFECEEMADSEGEEGSDCEQIADLQDKEAVDAMVEKAAKDADSDDLQENHQNSHGTPPGEDSVGGKSTSPSSEPELTGKVTDQKRISSWLSLNSSGPRSPLLAESKRVENIEEDNLSKKFDPPLKRTKSSTESSAEENLPVVTSSHVGIISLVSPPRKSRKRACRSRSLNL
ncbi:hypothetical protein RJ641_018044 [Dillenia turbinata]|uniref:Myb-like domain-containing protein n=1 Tax=Dillenia turbinata TaxID=194707 RepID=A0AAN8UWR0_9MAGN